MRPQSISRERPGEHHGNHPHPIDLPDPVEAIKFRTDPAGLSIKDPEPMIGQPNRVYEVHNHKRPLTLRMIRNLNKGLGISAQVLITDNAKKIGKLAVGA